MNDSRKWVYYFFVFMFMAVPGYLFYMKAIHIPKNIYLYEFDRCYSNPREYNVPDISELVFMAESTNPRIHTDIKDLTGFNVIKEKWSRWSFVNLTKKPIFKYPNLDDSEEIIVKNDFLRYYKYHVVKCSRIGVKIQQKADLN